MTVFGFCGCQVVIQFRIEPLARIWGKVESLSVSHKLQDISCAIEDSATMRAILEVRRHHGTGVGIYFIVEVIRDMPPNLYAVDFDRSWCQVPKLLPFWNKSRTLSLSYMSIFKKVELSRIPAPFSTRRRSPAPARHAS